MIPHKKYLKNLVSKDHSRYALNGVKFNEETSEIVATNGKLAAFYKVPSKSFKNVDCVIPLDSFDFDKGAINDNENTPIFEGVGEKVQVSQQIIDKNKNDVDQITKRAFLEGRFPNANDCIPKKTPNARVILSLDYLKDISNSVSSIGKDGNVALFEIFDEDSPVLISPLGSESPQGFMLMPVSENDKVISSYFNEEKYNNIKPKKDVLSEIKSDLFDLKEEVNPNKITSDKKTISEKIESIIQKINLEL